MDFYPPFLQPQVLFTTNEPQSYVFGGRNHPLHSTSQKRILEDYARKNGFTNIRHFTDDGIRETTFKRPGLDAMLDEIRAGNVATVIIKDLSRLGKDYIEAGRYTDIVFPSTCCRSFALNNGVDTIHKNNEMLAILKKVMKNKYHLEMPST